MNRVGLSAPSVLRPSIQSQPFLPCLATQCRTMFASKWIKRLDRFMEKHRRPPRPNVPDTMTYDNIDPRIKPINPMLGSKRTGVPAYKVGMMSLWDEWGQRFPITVCKIDRCRVIEKKTLARHGYEALQLGTGYKAIHRQTKNDIGKFIKAGVGPKRHINEMRVSSDCLLPVGTEITARHFVAGQWVFVGGITKGKGFKSAFQRWKFRGAMTRKANKNHRLPGSIGQGQAVGHVWKGKKMAGHKGPDPRVRNCKVFRIDAYRDLVFLIGSLPGYTTSQVKIWDARGKTAQKNKHIKLPYPTFIPVKGVEYPTMIQMPPEEADPFLYPDLPLYSGGD